MTGPIHVKSRDVAREAYRIETEAGAAYLPECLINRLRGESRPSHQTAYEWIGAHSRNITRAVAARVDGKTPKPPYDLITLIEETR